MTTTTTTTRDRFATLADARTELTGTGSWEWAPGTSWDAWTEYAYRYAVEIIDEMGDRHWDHDATLAAYLLSAGANPADFQLDPTDVSGTGPAAEVRAMAERELTAVDASTDAPFELRSQIDTAIEFCGGEWSWFVADLCDRDVTPGACNRWWVAYDGYRAAVCHEGSDDVVWTDAVSPETALARVLSGTVLG